MRAIWPVVIGVAGVAILVGLGVWQVQRLAWKEGILAEIDARIGAAPVALPAAPEPARDRYLPVTAEGRYVGPEVHVLVSVKQVGPGYRVIQGFETRGRRILVDRGFIPTEAKNSARVSGEATLIGNLHWPDEVDGYTPPPDLGANIWFARDVPALAEHLGTEPVMLILAGSSEADSGVAPLPVDTSGIPNDHLQYAITWFSLAAIWAAMTGFWIWTLRRKDKTT